MPEKSSPVGLPLSSTTDGWVSGDASCAASSVGVGDSSCFSTRSATITRVSVAPTPSWLFSAEAPNSSEAVVTAATREPYVAPENSLANTSLSWSPFAIASGAPLS